MGITETGLGRSTGQGAERTQDKWNGQEEEGNQGGGGGEEKKGKEIATVIYIG